MMNLHKGMVLAERELRIRLVKKLDKANRDEPEWLVMVIGKGWAAHKKMPESSLIKIAKTALVTG